ncbi:MAG: hypothetical protein QOK25_1648 [Thermoleophilaceae bacterium]|nr:hypothetical protein [Thermoleophilaceae bacterium]
MSRPLRHLWAGDWRAESERARRAREEADLPAPALNGDEARQPEPPETPPTDYAKQPAPSGPSRRSLAGALVLAAVVAIAFVVASLTGGGDSSPQTSSSLPAVSGAPVKPRKGHTRAAAIYAAASPAVVSVRTGVGAGTAFLIDSNGTLVTNGHVVEGSGHVTVRFGTQTAAIDATVRGTDPSSDLAVLKIEPSKVPKGVRPLQFADSSAIAVGDSVIAIGNPFDLDRTATEGIVSALGRHIQAPNGFEIDAAIQTDAPINPGNSGGPLLDDAAHVVGVNSQIQTGGGSGNVGIGFAVPSNIARAVVPILERGGTVTRAYLGVTTTPASATNPGGARVTDVVAGGPADSAGIRPGDVIVKVDGKPVQDPTDVSIAISGKKPGDKVRVSVLRNGLTEGIDVTLGTRPARTP